VPIVLKSGSLNLLEALGPVLGLLYLTKVKKVKEKAVKILELCKVTYHAT
jgi:hypothetical protein